VWAAVGLAPWGVSYSPLADTLTGPSLAIRPPSAAEQLRSEERREGKVPRTWSPKEPARVDLALKVAPTMPEDGFWVVSIEGEAGPIATGSSAEPETASLLLASAESVATHLPFTTLFRSAPWGVSYSPLADTLTGPS